MNLTPADDSAKRRRAKVVVNASTLTRKTLTTTRKKAVIPAAVSESAAQPLVDVHREIAKTAFCLAAERNFIPGHELDDWLEAERRIASRQSI